jgi:SPP1 gp7 family putative phage head morphogenesis protein
MEASDIDGYDWNWVGKYRDEVIEELTKAYIASFMVSLEPDVEVKQTISRDNVQRIAAQWAILEAEEQLVAYSSWTRQGVMGIVSDSVRDGRSIGQTTNLIRDDFLFSEKRARVIARTETARALGQGQKGAAEEQGRDEKRWATSGDDLVSDDCRENENAGWISITDAFPSGVDTVPQHPNCRCVVRYRTKELHDVFASFRCEGCNRLLGKEVHEGTRIVCRHCKAERVAERIQSLTLRV